MKELVEVIAKALVDHPEAVSIDERQEDEQKVLYSIHLLPITGPELGNIGILAHSVEFEKPLFDTAAFLMASYLSEPVVSASDAPI